MSPGFSVDPAEARGRRPRSQGPSGRTDKIRIVTFFFFVNGIDVACFRGVAQTIGRAHRLAINAEQTSPTGRQTPPSMKKSPLVVSFATTLLLCAAPSAHAAVTIAADDFSYTNTFTGFLGTADPVDWVTGDVASTSTWQGAGTGSSTTGGKWSYGDTGSGETFDGSLGFLPSSSRAISATILFEIADDVNVTTVTVGYTAEHWRSALSGNNNAWVVSWALNGVNQGTLSELGYVPKNTNATGINPAGGPWESVDLSTTVSGTFAPGDTIAIVFTGTNGTAGGARQGIAIDNFFLSVPEPSIALLGGLGLLGLLRRRR